jgi:hypothetical protein
VTSTPTRRVNELVLHLKGLILVRALLESRGASRDELTAHSEEITRVRTELAQVVRRSEASVRPA